MGYILMEHDGSVKAQATTTKFLDYGEYDFDLSLRGG